MINDGLLAYCADVSDVEPFAVALQAVVHEEVENGVRVDGDQPHGEGQYVVEVVQGKEVVGRMVPVDHQHEDGREPTVNRYVRAINSHAKFMFLQGRLNDNREILPSMD